ncbi:MAG: sugar phosphate isomerase/epimerase, partial [Nitrospirae bacterium]|nr:sugar phosphate isomerase/epimerase [Nitrospirota bacterium]
LDTVREEAISSLTAKLDYNPSISFHAPFMDLSPGAIDSKIRRATIERFNQLLDIADMLKPVTIVFHSGYEKWKYALKIDPWLEKSIETWTPLNKRAESIGARIAIENIFEDEPTNLIRLMEDMNSKNFGICFDAGHCHLFSRASIEDWINPLKPYIIELHLHDNNKTSDQHLPMGSGGFDFDKLFLLLKDNRCIYTIEAHSPESVLVGMERLKKYLAARTL